MQPGDKFQAKIAKFDEPQTFVFVEERVMHDSLHGDYIGQVIFGRRVKSSGRTAKGMSAIDPKQIIP